jgi:hypothetical protein
MPNLLNKLANYDATTLKYIGALTEDFVQMHGWGYMADSEAGAFLSMPLLERLDEVYHEYSVYQDTRDRRVARCIYAYTSTKLT